jgi:hemerythrin-like domain-containing protein
MNNLTQPLRDEHKELLPHLEKIREAGDLVGEVAPPVLRERVGEVHEFLVHHLIPHARAEEKALYPAVANVMRCAEATATMSRDHVEVGRLTEELQSLHLQLSNKPISRVLERDLRRVLYGLYTLIRVHFAKEEEVYLPLLDKNLTLEDAHRMFDAMEQAANEAKHQLAH